MQTNKIIPPGQDIHISGNKIWSSFFSEPSYITLISDTEIMQGNFDVDIECMVNVRMVHKIHNNEIDELNALTIIKLLIWNVTRNS